MLLLTLRLGASLLIARPCVGDTGLERLRSSRHDRNSMVIPDVTLQSSGESLFSTITCSFASSSSLLSIVATIRASYRATLHWRSYLKYDATVRYTFRLRSRVRASFFFLFIVVTRSPKTNRLSHGSLTARQTTHFMQTFNFNL